MADPTHTHDLRPFRHSHAFGSAGEAARGRALLQVTVVTLVTMAVELAAGWWTGSLALTADGWHMGTHAAALGGAVLAMRWSRRARQHEGFAFGGWKIEVLAAYTSALLLAAVALGLLVDAVAVLRQPRPIAFAEAMTVAVLGLVVNLASVWLLARGGMGHLHHHHGGSAHDHDHDQGHDRHAHAHHAHVHHGHDHHGHDHHGHDHHAHRAPVAHGPAAPPQPARGHAHHDHNFRAAYVHVLADALTSVWPSWRWPPACGAAGAGPIRWWR